MINKRTILLILVPLIIFTSVIIAINIYTHEMVHNKIFLYLGCDDIEMKFGVINSYTTANCSMISDESRLTVDLANSINEVVGYQLTPFLILISSLLFLIILINNEEDK